MAISKKRKQALAKVDPKKAYNLAEASSLVKEIARLGGSVGGLIPDVVEKALKEKLS